MIQQLVLPFALLAAATQAAGIVGTWRGTSLCSDKIAYPACHDEVAHYDIRAKGSSRDTVIVKAGKIVNGAFEEISTDDFVRQPDGSWKTEIPRYRVQIVLRVAGDSITGRLTDSGAAKKVRDIALTRQR